jgi:hypothetical protein
LRVTSDSASLSQVRLVVTEHILQSFKFGCMSNLI